MKRFSLVACTATLAVASLMARPAAALKYFSTAQVTSPGVGPYHATIFPFPWEQFTPYRANMTFSGKFSVKITGGNPNTWTTIAYRNVLGLKKQGTTNEVNVSGGQEPAQGDSFPAQFDASGVYFDATLTRTGQYDVQVGPWTATAKCQCARNKATLSFQFPGGDYSDLAYDAVDFSVIE